MQKPPLSQGDEPIHSNKIVIFDAVSVAKTSQTMTSFIETVARCSDTNGRSCTVHCGTSVAMGDKLQLMECIIECNGVNEVAVKCVKVVDGQDTCTVAFIPRVTMSLPKVQQHLNKFVQVSELLSPSKNTCKLSKLEANCRMASVELLPENSGRMEQKVWDTTHSQLPLLQNSSKASMLHSLPSSTVRQFMPQQEQVGHGDCSSLALWGRDVAQATLHNVLHVSKC